MRQQWRTDVSHEHAAAQLDAPCPVPDQTLGDLYRAGPRGLTELIATVPAATRAILAIYCFRRAHLASIGIAIAATCEREDLTAIGGNTGAALFDRSRESITPAVLEPHSHVRRKITLATGPLRRHATFLDQEDLD
jgi:hypothetical protein